eukprot:TRINITY_DN3251_c0_g1_i9.p1 TRINITY_DN3251_c0_g1~~TRINITY_DN3251_c0_g1_i9.p1  ORF type:complete len:450 (+),score=132.35 TRINITY_DN3251_c0_g1_i9:102-1451(+)
MCIRDSLTAAQKAAKMWTLIKNSEYKASWSSKQYPDGWYSLSLAKLFTESMDEPFDRFADNLPAGRERLIHSFGSVAQVKLTAAKNNTFTGLFEGADHGVIRLSLAANPAFAGFTPGFGLKFFRDGQPSGNIISMYALSGQGSDYNFFKHSFKNHVPSNVTGALTALAGAFAKGALNPTKIAVDGFSAADQRGKTATQPKFPEMVYWKPNKALTGRFKAAKHEFRADLATIAPGTMLYEVFAVDHGECLCSGEPCADFSTCNTTKIGELSTSSGFVASKWGDDNIFFQHYRWSKKTRATCTYAQALAADTLTALPADTKTSCEASSSSTVSCPEVGGFLGFGGSKGTLSPGCPFDGVLNGVQPTSLNAFGTKGPGNDSSNGAVVALIVCMSVAAVLGAVAVGVWYKRRQGVVNDVVSVEQHAIAPASDACYGSSYDDTAMYSSVDAKVL